MPPTSTDTQDVWPDEPYKGLQYYSAADRRLFSGREHDIDVCVLRLTSPETRILLLHGYTGCGKSSFLRAGLIPAIEDAGPEYCFLRDADETPLFIRSGHDPLGRIAEEIHRLASAPVVVRGRKAVDLSDLIAPYTDVQAFVTECHEPNVLVELLQAISKRILTTLVIVLDQAEEVITLDDARHTRKRQFFRFVREFHAANFPVKLVIALRSEYSGLFVELGQDDGSVDLRQRVPSALWQPGGDANQSLVRSDIKLFLLRELEKNEVKEAILLPTSTAEEHGNPFAKYGFMYAGDVIDEIVGDLFKTGTTAALPAMQLTCRDLYNNLPPDRKITREQYIKGGRITGPVDRHISKSLRNAFGALGAVSPKVEEKRWRDVLCSLVQGESGGAVRTRILATSELKGIAMQSGVVADFDTVVARLSEPDVLLLRRVPSGTSQDGMKLSLGHDFIGLVLHQWQTTQKAAEEAAESARKKIRKTRRRALWMCAAFAFVGILAVAFSYAEVLGRSSERYDVLVSNAQYRERTDYSGSMLTAALAIGVAAEHKHWIGDSTARAALAKVLAGRPGLTVMDPLKDEAATGSTGTTTRSFPLPNSGGFVQVRGNTVRVREKTYRLPANESTGESLWKSNDYAVSETGRGTILMLVTELTVSRNGISEQQQKLYVVSDAAKEDLDQVFDLAYFRGLTNLPAEAANAAGNTNAFLGLNEGRVTLSVIRTSDSTANLWVRSFAFDENAGFNVAGAKLDRLPVTLENAAGIPGSLSLGDYVIVSEPGAGDEPNLVRHSLFRDQAQPNAATARATIALPAGRNWQMAGSANTPDGPLLFLGSPRESERYNESWAPRAENFSDVLVVNVATLRTRSVGAAKIQEARIACGEGEPSPPGSVATREMEKDPISFGASGNAPLAVISNGQSADIVSIADADPVCLGRLYFPGRIDRWIVAKGRQFRLSTVYGNGFGWDMSTPIRERARRLSGEPDLVRQACDSDLRAMIANPAGVDWQGITGVPKLPPELTSKLCAGTAAPDAHVSR